MVSAATRSRAQLTDGGTAHAAPNEATRAGSLVADAAHVVGQRWARLADLSGESVLGDAESASSALCVLALAVAAGIEGAPLPSLAAYPWTAEAPQLIAGLRREILSRAEQPHVAAADVLAALRVLERLLQSLEDDVASRFVEHLIGPHALQLLVEVAHDMRSPLGSILLLVERMRRGVTGPLSALQERHLGLVYSAAFGLSSLAGDVLDLARGGGRLIGPTPVAFFITDVLHAVRDVVQPIAEEKGLTLRFSAPAGDRRIGHPAALNRVLLNLVTNAIKFTDNGSVTVTVDVAETGMVHFCIEDTGRGMPPAVAARVTEIFSRSCATGDFSFSSAGLGIAICRKLVDAMGGTMTIARVTPVGTRVHVAVSIPQYGI